MRKPRFKKIFSVVFLSTFFFFSVEWATRFVEQSPQVESGYLQEALVKNESLSWGIQRRTDHRTPHADPLSVRLLEGKGFWVGDPEVKQVYLTFNCGWENGQTGLTLDILHKHRVPAAFFVTGEYAGKNPELLKRMAVEGHLVGSHGETHRSFPLLSEEEMLRELAVSSQKITLLTGRRPEYFRPPSSDFNQKTLNIAREQGFTTVFWSLSYPDWDTERQPGRQAVFQRIMGDIHPGAVIQLHTVSSSNNEALGDIIKELLAQGYTPGSLDEIEIIKTPSPSQE